MKDPLRLIPLAVFCILALPATLAEAQTATGDWTMQKAEAPGEVVLSISLGRDHGPSRSTSPWAKGSFEGLDFSQGSRREVRFSATREAGRFDFEGYLAGSEGAGLFRFSPDAAFPRDMEALGFPIDERDQLHMAVHDVTTGFAREMQGADLAGLDGDALLALRIHGADLAYIEELRAAGCEIESSDLLIAFRVHGITPAWVRALESDGLTPDDSKLIAMKVHGVSPSWIREIAELGYSGVSEDKLIAFRVHGIDPAYIGALQEVGYDDLKADRLIAFKVHGTTADFIREIQDLGFAPGVDEVIALRVHGVTPEFVESLGSEAVQRGISYVLETKILGGSRR